MTSPHSADSRGRGGLAADTSAEAERRQVEMWRRMSSVDKARLVTDLTRTAEELALAGIRMRHPGATERECLLRLAVLKLGPELAARVYPEAAALIDS